MRRARPTIGLVLLTSLAGVPLDPSYGQAAPPQQEAPPPSFRSEVDIVSLNVTVIDGTGRYVTDLEQSEFQVFENGIQQEITIFSKRKNPIGIVLLLDSSASMEYKLPTLKDAAIEFVRTLNPVDLAQVVDFDDDIKVLQPFTSNHEDLSAGIKKLSAGGPTALHNAIYVSLMELRRLKDDDEENPRRKALIVFSDGADTDSLLTFDELLDEAKRSETAIYTIGLRDERSQKAGFSSPEYVLRQLAIETGGFSHFPTHIAELAAVYRQIAEELANQYSLGYVSKNPRRDGAWRPIVVQTTRPKLTARTKRGYFAPTR